MIETLLFAAVALVVVGAWVAQRQRRRRYEASEPDDDVTLDEWSP